MISFFPLSRKIDLELIPTLPFVIDSFFCNTQFTGLFHVLPVFRLPLPRVPFCHGRDRWRVAAVWDVARSGVGVNVAGLAMGWVQQPFLPTERRSKGSELFVCLIFFRILCTDTLDNNSHC